ncbi:MAG: hypothetical protein V1871_00805 [Planctomycetota bacterium]
MDNNLHVRKAPEIILRSPKGDLSLTGFTLLCIWMFLIVFSGCYNPGNIESGSRLKAFKDSPKPEGANDEVAPDSGAGHQDKDRGDKNDDHDRRAGSSSQTGEYRGGDYYSDERNDDRDSWDINLDMSFLFDDRIRFLKYPYAYNDPIYQKNSDTPGKTIAGTFKSYYMIVDNNIWAYNLSEELKFSTGISEEISYTKYIEDVSNQHADEEMGCLKFYFNWLGAEDTNSIVKIGVGGEHISGIGGGASFQGAIDLFPREPWGLSGSVSYSFMEDHVRIADFEFKLGYFKKHNEFDIGYRSLMNSHGDNLNGPFVGVAFWF